MKYVSNTGVLIKLTSKQWEKYLLAKSRDHNAMPEEYGSSIGAVIDVTDWTCGDADVALTELHNGKK